MTAWERERVSWIHPRGMTVRRGTRESGEEQRGAGGGEEDRGTARGRRRRGY